METEFNDDEFRFAYPDGIENNYWNKARRSIILAEVKKLPIRKLLDVGSGRGIVTDFLHRKGVPVQGVELGKSSPISNADVPILYGTNALDFSSEESKAYNALSLFDVIEHIADPVKFMKELVVHFDHVEYLIVTVPARRELWSNFDEYYGHFKRYDLEVLDQEMKKVGFEITVNRYFFNSIYFVMRVSNRVFRKRNISFKVPTGFSGFIHAVLAGIFYVESKVVPHKFRGSSIICIAKKIKN